MKFVGFSIYKVFIMKFLLNYVEDYSSSDTGMEKKKKKKSKICLTLSVCVGVPVLPVVPEL